MSSEREDRSHASKLSGVIDDLGRAAAELAGMEAAARSVEGPHEAEGVSRFARHTRELVMDANEATQDVWHDLRRRDPAAGTGGPATTVESADPVEALALALRTTSLLMDDALEALEDRE